FAIAVLSDILTHEGIGYDQSFRAALRKACRLVGRFASAVDCDAENLLLLLNDFLGLLPSNTIVLDALDECLEDAEETGQGKEIRPHEAGRLLVYLREVALKTSSRIIILTRSSHFSSTALVD